MHDMIIDLLGDTAYGKAAYKKLGNVSENFRLYYAGWVGDKDPSKCKEMVVKGAEFRKAKRGKNKGKMTVRVPDTTRTVIVTIDDMKAFLEE